MSLSRSLFFNREKDIHSGNQKKKKKKKKKGLNFKVPERKEKG
jgi:hypothetical protein